MIGGAHHRIRDLAVRDDLGPGIAFSESTHSTLERSAVSGNRSQGVELVGADHNEVVNNRIARNGQGIELLADSDDNLILRNRVTANELPAVPSLGFGIGLGGTGRGGSLGDDRNQILRNTVIRNGGDGIWIGPSTDEGNLVARNRAHRNGHDGITVLCLGSECRPPTSTLTRNTANRNVNLGIEAAPGVRDAGGNKARGNGNPAQCLNVACS
jgi:parallel beta-helix repeat protein